jgi:hypothetical protein
LCGRQRRSQPLKRDIFGQSSSRSCSVSPPTQNYPTYSGRLTFFSLIVLVTGTIQLLLWRDKKRAKQEETARTVLARRDSSDSPASEVDEKRTGRIEEITPVNLD